MFKIGNSQLEGNPFIRSEWTTYSYESTSAEAKFKEREPATVEDPKSRLRKKGGSITRN